MLFPYRSIAAGKAVLATIALAAAGGFAARSLHVPLPWMLGSLSITAAASAYGLRPRATVVGRSLSQVVIGTGIGLAFTPAACAALASDIGAMVALASLSIAITLVVSAGTSRLFRLDPVLACVMCLPLGPLEATNLGSRFGFHASQIVFAQSIRVVLIVITIPPALFWIEQVDPNQAAVAAASAPIQLSLVLLLCGCVLAARLFMALRMPNAPFLGALTFSAAATAIGMNVSSMPSSLTVAAQILLGISLGVAIDRDLIKSAGRLAAVAFASATVLIGLCLLLGVAAAAFLGRPWDMMVLAATPGGLAEMSLAARLLHADAVGITAFHVVRIYILLLLAPFLLRWISRWWGPCAES